MHGVAGVKQRDQHKFPAVQFGVGYTEGFGADGAVVVKEKIKVNDPRASSTVDFRSAELLFNCFAAETELFGFKCGTDKDDTIVKPVLLLFADWFSFVDAGCGRNGYFFKCREPVQGFLEVVEPVSNVRADADICGVLFHRLQ